MSIEEFCELIQKEYLYYLYKRKIVFPYCCHTSANLISSYLTVHFDEHYEHRVCAKKRHGWTANSKQMIDFTGFQFYISHKLEEKFRNQSKNISKEEFYEIIDLYKDSSPLFSEKSTEHFKSWNEELSSVTNCDLYGIEFAKKVSAPLTLDGFMNYVEDALEPVDVRVIKSGLYR